MRMLSYSATCSILMEASTTGGRPPRQPVPPAESDAAKIRKKLLRNGVYPTPKIIHTLRKKELQKSLRKSKRFLANQPVEPLTEHEKESAAELAHFQAIKAEYKSFRKSVNAETEASNGNDVSVVGKPWESLSRIAMRELASQTGEYKGEKLKTEHFWELSDIIENERDKFRWLLDDDIEMEEGWLEKEKPDWASPKRRPVDSETIRFLVNKLSGTELNVKDWKFSRMMKQSGLQFAEGQLLKILDGLAERRQWKHALSVVDWVYSSKERRNYKSRFVYTKLLAVIGKARKPHEALKIFNLMRGDYHIYPDMAAYRSVAVTLGQAGLLKELVNVIDCMRQKPSRKMKDIRRKNWDPVLQPDLVVYNAVREYYVVEVLNACVPSCQWKGVLWVFEQLRKSGLKPNGATYGLAMEVMLQSGKYDYVHKYFGQMKKSGESPKAATYKVLVKTLWREGKVNEAVQAVRDMEGRGVVGTACVYYELACCLCNKGRWQEAMLEIEKLKKLPFAKPLATFTGMILSSMGGGHIDDCVSIFEQSKAYCAPNIGIINAMLKVFGRNDLFFKAKELFEEIRRDPGSDICLNSDVSPLIPDAFTYNSMLEASACAFQWEYFEFVYKEMTFYGYKLDQHKYATLLVKASKAGKWHLLEHAFDSILEAGEIPHPALFTEMVCQAIVLQDHERAVTIINTMAHASFEVSEQQWISLFLENEERLNKACLEQLLHTLQNHEIVMEASVSNLFRSLQSLCGTGDLRRLSNSTGNGNCKLFGDGNGRALDGDGGVNMKGFDASLTGANPGKNPEVDNSDAISTVSVNHTSNCRKEDVDGRANMFANIDRLIDELALNDLSDCFDDRNPSDGHWQGDDNEDEFEASIGEVGNSRDSNLPSPNQILETWKESRKSDGTFFPFSLDPN